jgi:hypothetical protein
VFCIAFSSSPGLRAPARPAWAWAQVDAAKQRATIDRGTKAGPRAGDTGGVYAMRGQGRQKVISLEERVAIGKIIEVKDTTAVIALDAVVDTVEVGAYFSTSIDAPR